MKFRGGEFSTGTTGNFQSELTKGQHVAQLLNQEDLPGVFEPLDSSSLAALRTG
jgi:hypothetical protein